MPIGLTCLVVLVCVSTTTPRKQRCLLSTHRRQSPKTTWLWLYVCHGLRYPLFSSGGCGGHWAWDQIFAMVQHKEVEQLYVLAHREFAQYLGDKLIKSSYNERRGNATLSTVRQKLRPYFLEHIPTAGITFLFLSFYLLFFKLKNCNCGKSRENVAWLWHGFQLRRTRHTLTRFLIY